MNLVREGLLTLVFIQNTFILSARDDDILEKVVKQKQTEQTPWPQSASELYRPSDRRLSAKLVPTCADRGVSRSQRGESPAAVISMLMFL
jgi:hypothetical protein